MNHVIYKDSDDNIRAYKAAKKSDFDEFVKTLSVEQILFKDGSVNEDNVPESQKDIFPAILKSFMKQWSLSQSILQPKEKEPAKKVVKEEGVDLVIEDTPVPKKRSRKKKAV